ncbi:MAG: type IV pilus modification protein PilV [Pseudomonadales bacterium]
MMTQRRLRRSITEPAAAHLSRVGGFSLIEVLVAVLVMGIGVLGVSALQMVSLQNNRGALERAEAVHLAYDMMDRIRANPGGTPAGAAYGGLGVGDGPPAANNCIANNCSTAQMVAFDQASWKCQLGEYKDEAVCVALRAAGALPSELAQPGLPGGDGAITVSGAGVIQVTVQWRGIDGTEQTVVIDSQG